MFGSQITEASNSVNQKKPTEPKGWTTSELEIKNNVAIKLAKILVSEAHKGDATALRIYKEALEVE
jgi:N-acetylglucosamine kinase-like BadF-type ATPase